MFSLLSVFSLLLVTFTPTASAVPATYRARSDGLTYTGAGILIFEQKYTRGLKPNEPAVILYQNRRTRAFEDLGGLLDREDLRTHYPLAHGAAREAKEESNGYVSFENTGVFARDRNGRQTFVRVGDYRAYAVGIKSGRFSSQDAQYRLEHNNSDREMKKTTRVYLSDLLPLLNVRGDLIVRNAKGEVIRVAGRTKRALREMFARGIPHSVLANTAHGATERRRLRLS